MHQLYLLASSAKISKEASEGKSGSSKKRYRENDREGARDDGAGSQTQRVCPVEPGMQSETAFTPKELSKIRNIALTNGCFGLLCVSLCPDIFGHELVKAGLLLGLLGGSRHGDDAEELTIGASKECSIRSDIHVLIVGDPGLGKSQVFILVYGFLVETNKTL